MKTVCYYVADDGTKFEDRYECERYEVTQAILCYKEDFEIFNCYGRPLPIDENVDPNPVYYLKVKSAEAVQALKNWFNFYGNECPFEYYDSFENSKIAT